MSGENGHFPGRGAAYAPVSNSSPPGSRDALNKFREKKLDVTVSLQELGDFAGAIGAKTLKERIARDLVDKLEEDRFHLVVVGEFNHGKSSFVNALLGREVLPTGVTPTTATIHHLKYSEEPEATVVFSSGKREKLGFDDVRRFAVGGDKGQEAVDFLEVGYPASLLKERILLVDTPGVNDLSLQRADITYSYIPRADAVLFLLDAGQILKESERVFLQEKLLKASRDKIVFVVTKWDILSPSEREEALGYAKTQLQKLVVNPIIFPISAETAISGKQAESGLPELVAYLTKFLAEERGRILLDNALGEGLSVASLLQKGLDARARATAMKSDELERRIAALTSDLEGQATTIEERRSKIREEVQGIKVGANKDLQRFIDELVQRIPSVVDSAKGEDLKQYLPAFLEDTFKRWAEAESKEIAQQLEALAEKTVALVREDAHDRAKSVAEALGATDVKNIDVEIDRFKYDVGIFALFSIGLGVMFANALVGGLLTLAAPVLALFVKDRVEGEYRKRVLEIAPEVLRTAGAKLGPKIAEMVDEFAAKLDAWVVSAGEELHREVLEVLRATQSARAAGEQDSAKITEELSAQALQLQTAETRIEELRKSLWTPESTEHGDVGATPIADRPPRPGTGL